MVERIVRVVTGSGPAWGVVDEGVVHWVEGLGGTPEGRGASGPVIGRLADLTPLAPALPTKIVCVGRNYGAHAAEHGVEIPSEPLIFLKPPSSVVGPGADIVLPPQSERVEHEGELALVIGRRCRNLVDVDVWPHVAGITCANDVTARDLQRRDGQWTRGKGFDTFCPVGPWLVTGLSEMEVSDLMVACRVNGELRQRGQTRDMAFPPAHVVAYVSSFMTLEPGDLVLTGTPAGVGPLTSGDVVEVEVEKVGVLRNRVR